MHTPEGKIDSCPSTYDEHSRWIHRMLEKRKKYRTQGMERGTDEIISPVMIS